MYVFLNSSMLRFRGVLIVSLLLLSFLLFSLMMYTVGSHQGNSSGSVADPPSHQHCIGADPKNINTPDVICLSA